ncbi:MAG: hypothetical protein P8X43_14210 [Maritimibacter sp.]
MPLSFLFAFCAIEPEIVESNKGTGKVIARKPAPKSFAILKNCAEYPHTAHF